MTRRILPAYVAEAEAARKDLDHEISAYADGPCRRSTEPAMAGFMLCPLGFGEGRLLLKELSISAIFPNGTVFSVSYWIGCGCLLMLILLCTPILPSPARRVRRRQARS